MKRRVPKDEIFLLGIIMLVAIFFRIYRLDAIPRGMSGDEAVRGLEALPIMRGERYPVFLEGSFGEEPMHGYLVAVIFRLFGPSVLAIRVASVLVGVLTVPVFYFTVRALFPPPEGSRPWLAILATAWLSTSYWHTVYSRWGSEPIVAPLFAVLTVYCLWRAFNSGRRLDYVCAGASLGLSLYTYQAARFLPIFALVLVGHHAYVNRRSLRSQWASLLSLLLAFLIVVTPMAAYALNHPEIYFARTKAVSVFSPDRTVTPLTSLLLGFVKTAGMYNFHGDEHPEHSPSQGRPVLDPLSSVCFALGLAVTLYRFRDPPYFLLAMWLLVMSVPAAITASGSVSFSRTIGALPAVYIFPAIGVLETWEWLGPKVKSGRHSLLLCSSLALAPILFATATTYRDYFVAWDTREDLRWGYDGAYTEAAAVMNETHIPDSVWILPLTSYVPSGYGADHFDFLYHGGAPYFSVSLDEATAPGEISDICRNKRTAVVLDWKGYVLEEAYTAMSADPKRLLPFLFEKYGRELNRKSYEAFDLATYELPESPSFSMADRLDQLAVRFGNELTLSGMAFGGSSRADSSTPQEVEQRTLPAGKSGWVVLRWRATRAPSRDYKVAVYLEDEGGHIAGQVDKLLLSNSLHQTSDWQAGQEEIDYYTLQSWSGTAPGWYKVGVTVYDADTANVVYAGGGGRSYELGMMEVVRPLSPGQVKPDVESQNQEGEVAGRIRLLGYDLPRRELNPGDELGVALYWQALKDVDRDYLLALQLANERGETWADEFDAPVYGSYPTLQWTEGEILKEWHDMSLPADLPQGRYQVSLLVAEDGSLLQEVNLEAITVSGRPRHFTVPEIQHPQQAILGEEVQFLGYDLGGDEVKPGDRLHLTLYWQALKEMQTSYTVFTHLLDSEERIWGQMDSIPGRGEAPTTSWVAGEVISDEYELVVAPEAPPGEYVIEIGVYGASSGQRLSVYDLQGERQGDRILLQATPVLVAE